MNFEINEFKDGQVTARILNDGDLHVKIRGNSYQDLFSVASVKEAWNHYNKTNKVNSELTLYCLIGQRSDRRFGPNESFDLKVISNFINAMGFDKVNILHPHSSVCLALIHNSVQLSHFQYVQVAYEKLNKGVLVSPDAGAYKTTYEIADRLDAPLVAANKVRIMGLPKVTVQGNVKGKECLIVDDLADGGRTFKFLAEELKNQGAEKVYLYVTHGQFNYGFDELKEFIDHIYCTNSFRNIKDGFVTQFEVI